MGWNNPTVPAAFCSAIFHAPSPPGAIRIILTSPPRPHPRLGHALATPLLLLAQPGLLLAPPRPRPRPYQPLPDPAPAATSGEFYPARGAAAMAVTAEGARRKERVLCLFDVDGTLTPARQVGPRRSEARVGSVSRTPGGLKWGLRRRDPDPRD